MSFLRFEHIKKIYPNGFEAVKDFCLDVEKGEFIVLVGPSGCGKTTTLRMLAGLEDISSGTISINDKVINEYEPKDRDIAMVFQNYALYPHMTVRDNMTYGLKFRKVPKEERKDIVVETAKLVQVDEYLQRKPSQLSGGQQQRVAIARALVKRPKVLLLDEPLSNLDARLRLQTREEIKRIQRDTGITTVFVTHDQEEAMSISDQIVVMKLGVMQQMDSPQTVYNNPANLFVAQFLGTPPINVFKGEIKDGKVMIGTDVIYELEDKVEDRPVTVAIRPEGFALGKEGDKVGLQADVDMVQILGRDISIVAKNEACTKPTFKVIVSNEDDLVKGHIVLSVKPSKMFLFDVETEERLRIK